jgi:hypothetical protein
MSPRDIYGEADGPKIKVETCEDIFAALKAAYPNGYIEGSTGEMFTLWNDRVPVGSAWKVKTGWFYRLRVTQ